MLEIYMYMFILYAYLFIICVLYRFFEYIQYYVRNYFIVIINT